MREEQRLACWEASQSSAYWHLLGIELVEVKEGLARVRMPFRPELQQGYGAMHGGALASLADSSMAVALISLVEPGQRVYTVEMKVNYLSAVLGGQVVAEARIVQKGRSLAVGETHIRDEGGMLVAVGLATFAIRNAKKGSPGNAQRTGEVTRE